MLYENLKPPKQHLFTAAAALYHSTWLPQYRAEADYYWDAAFATFIFNWNNVAPQVLRSTTSCLDVVNLLHKLHKNVSSFRDSNERYSQLVLPRVVLSDLAPSVAR